MGQLSTVFKTLLAEKLDPLGTWEQKNRPLMVTLEKLIEELAEDFGKSQNKSSKPTMRFARMNNRYYLDVSSGDGEDCTIDVTTLTYDGNDKDLLEQISTRVAEQIMAKSPRSVLSNRL